MVTDHVSLKAFWDAVERRLTTSSAGELAAILRAMAHDTPPSGRGAFLARLNVEPDAAAMTSGGGSDDNLLADIDDWIAEYQDAQAEAEPGEEDYDDDWYGNSPDDEDSPGPYAELLEPLTALFDRAQAAFDYGNLPLARRAYLKLFTEALDQEDDYGRAIHVDDLSAVDAGEARARYLCAVYETEAAAQRPEIMFEELLDTGSWLSGPRVLLDDVIQISPKPLPELDRFFREWIAFLRQHSGRDADTWLREAIRLTQGARGLEELARAEGRARPFAFVNWLAVLAAEQRPYDVLAAARLALATLPASLPVRAEIADYLCSSAATLSDAETVRWGRREAFPAQPTLDRLVNLWEVAPDPAEQTQAMREAAQYLVDSLAQPRPSQTGLEAIDEPDGLARPAWVSKSILGHAYLLAQEWLQAQSLAGREEVLGWSRSENTQGLIVPCFLALLATRPAEALPPNVAEVWRQALENTTHVSFSTGIPGNTLGGRLQRAYRVLMARVTLDTDQAVRFQSWCVEITRKRVAAIVGNQHRGSYAKAATLTLACVEALRRRGQEQEADRVLAEVCEQFPRHRNFQDQLKVAIARTNRV